MSDSEQDDTNWREDPQILDIRADADVITLIAGTGVGHGSPGAHDVVPPHMRPTIGLVLAGAPNEDGVAEVHAFAMPYVVMAAMHGQLEAMFESLPRELRVRWRFERARVKDLAATGLEQARRMRAGDEHS